MKFLEHSDWNGISRLPNATARKAVACAVLSAALAQVSAPASAQMLPDISVPFDSSMSTQTLTDAVTQGFRQRDRVFFEEGVQQFEGHIEALQKAEPVEPVLVIEPVLDDWQLFESLPEVN
ncbi:MAG: hypothetical protein AAF703_10855 [Cyanobacteria bacterium P01_D01_bin.105]